MTSPLSPLLRRLATLLLIATLAFAFGTPGALTVAAQGDITNPDGDDNSDADSSADDDDDTADLTNETGDDADDDTADFTNETGDDTDDDTADLTNETGDDADDTGDLTNETGDDGTQVPDDGGDDDDGGQGDGVEELPNTGSGNTNGTGMTEWLAIAGVVLAVVAGFLFTRRMPRAG